MHPVVKRPVYRYRIKATMTWHTQTMQPRSLSEMMMVFPRIEWPGKQCLRSMQPPTPNSPATMCPHIPVFRSPVGVVRSCRWHLPHPRVAAIEMHAQQAFNIALP
jgi:hypothetical protein